jgi:hypothetical protein
MWKLEPTEECGRRFRYYEKKRPRELKAVLVNQATYLAALQAGNKPLQIKYGFVHVEQNGVIALDQKRGGGNLAQTRLYLYPDTEAQVLYQVTLGDKRTQPEDVKFSSRFVEGLRKRKQEKDEPAKGEADASGQEEAVQ